MNQTGKKWLLRDLSHLLMSVLHEAACNHILAQPSAAAGFTHSGGSACEQVHGHIPVQLETLPPESCPEPCPPSWSLLANPPSNQSLITFLVVSFKALNSTCTSVLFPCLSVHYVCTYKCQRNQCSPRNWSYRWLSGPQAEF